MMRLKILSIMFILFTQVLYGQANYVYRGVVLDSLTNKGIEGVHVFTNENSRIGSTSNSDGAFVLKSTQKLDKLLFSHINYQLHSSVIADVPTSKNRLKIILKPSVQHLEQITVTALSARKVVLKAIEHLQINHFVEPLYYQFFTRVTNCSRDSVPDFLEEHVGYIYQKNNHNSDFNIQKSRMKAFSKEGTQKYKDHRLISMTEMYTDNMGKYTENYLHKRRSKNYSYVFGEDKEVMGRSCHSIHFNTDMNTYYKKGILYIDKEDYGILKKVLDNGDYKEITFNRIKNKYYLHATYYFKPRGNYFEIRNTIYNITTVPDGLEFTDKALLAPKFSKQVIGKFDDGFWEQYNYIPLPNWINEAIANTAKE